jgi:hypothetical protein
MSNMIEAAPHFRSTHGEKQAGWMSYIVSSAVSLGIFGIMLWLAS